MLNECAIIISANWFACRIRHIVECARFLAFEMEMPEIQTRSEIEEWKISRNGIKLIVNACNLESDPIFGVIPNSKDQRVFSSSSLLFYFKKMIPQTRWACNVEQLAIANNVLFSFFFFFAFDFVLENCMVHSMLNIILAHILIFTFAPLSMAKINLCI